MILHSPPRQNHELIPSRYTETPACQLLSFVCHYMISSKPQFSTFDIPVPGGNSNSVSSIGMGMQN